MVEFPTAHVAKVQIDGFDEPIDVIFYDRPKQGSVGFSGDRDADTGESVKIRIVEVRDGSVKYRGSLIRPDAPMDDS